MKISDIVCDWFIEKGITHAFGIIGAGDLELFNAISKKKEITLVCCHHEQAAVMASTFFNRVKGGLASVSIVTTGAGSSNAITGVLAAFMDSIPLMVISGNEPSNFFKVPRPRVTGVQGYSSAELIRPIVKYAEQSAANSKGMIQVDLDRAYNKAVRGRQGPVWLDLPRDLAAMEVSCN